MREILRQEAVLVVPGLVGFYAFGSSVVSAYSNETGSSAWLEDAAAELFGTIIGINVAWQSSFF